MIKVIVAEDIDVIRKRIIKNINKESDMQVVGEASTGLEITKVALSTDFDIAVLDIEMEGIDAGIVAARKIREVKTDAKIIFLTLHDNDDMIFSALGDGAVDYIIKSEDTTPLIEHIRLVTEGKNPMNLDLQRKLQTEFKRLQKSESELMFFIRTIAILTPAEKALIKLLVEGNSVKDIAKKRYVEVTTVKTQISHILKKLNVRRTRDIVLQIKEMNLESLLDTEPKV